MTCEGCKAAVTERAKAAMCHVCAWKPSCTTYRAATVKPMRFTTLDLKCPRRRWPDPIDGTCRWLRGRWIGVPRPIRWRINAERAWRAIHANPLPGCGCHARLKAAWVTIIGPIRRLANEAIRRRTHDGRAQASDDQGSAASAG